MPKTLRNFSMIKVTDVKREELPSVIIAHDDILTEESLPDIVSQACGQQNHGWVEHEGSWYAKLDIDPGISGTQLYLCGRDVTGEVKGILEQDSVSSFLSQLEQLTGQVVDPLEILMMKSRCVSYDFKKDFVLQFAEVEKSGRNYSTDLYLHAGYGGGPRTVSEINQKIGELQFKQANFWQRLVGR